MAICFAPLYTSFAGSGCQLKAREVLWSSAKAQSQRKHFHLRTNRNFAVRAEYSDDSRGGGGGADFVAGFVLGVLSLGLWLTFLLHRLEDLYLMKMNMYSGRQEDLYITMKVWRRLGRH